MRSRTGIAVVVVTLALAIYFANQNNGQKSNPVAPLSSTRIPIRVEMPTVRWVKASYRELLDPQELTRSGTALTNAISELPTRSVGRRDLQPFLEPMSALLLDVLAMSEPPSDLPLHNVAEFYPRGSAQPAWAALLRQGQLVVVADGRERAVAFVPGDDAKVAYERAYPVIRHVLAGLLPPDRSKLKVRVFAFKNDYATCKLQLNMQPLVIESDGFPPPGEKHPLDLDQLAKFLGTVDLVGGKLVRNGLTLVGQQRVPGAENRRFATPSDLAVAYRAIFHAGENEAFISLDPHRDPTRAKVNFGGLLEDTWIGTVVLEADKLFKTITSGLDPNSMHDLRATLRQSVPSFATVAERDLASRGSGGLGWIGTRFWYYPDSVELETDFDASSAVIRTARFVADAERSRDDYGSIEEFKRRKKDELSPSIRENITSLNKNYERFAAVLGPLRDLETVARLMGLCCWLKKAPVSDIDLDALLTVELPALRTPDYTTQLIAVTAMLCPENLNPGMASAHALDSVQKQAAVIYLTPILEQRVGAYFQSPENLGHFLASSQGRPESSSDFRQSAYQVFNSNENAKVCEIIHSKRDVEALAEYAAERVEPPKTSDVLLLESQINLEKSAIDGIEDRLNAIKARMAQSIETHNSLVDTYNGLVLEQRTRVSHYNQLVEKFNHQTYSNKYVVEIGGGIELSAESFKVKRAPESPLLKKLLAVTDGRAQTETSDQSSWSQAHCAAREDIPIRRLPLESTDIVQRSESESQILLRGQSPSGNRWLARERKSGVWREQESLQDGTTIAKYFDPATESLHIARFKDGQQQSYRVAVREGANEITFRNGKATILSPQEPPSWWTAAP